MTQYTLILKWHKDGENPTLIHNRLIDLFGDNALSLSTVSRTIRKLSWTADHPKPKPEVGKPPDMHNIQLIQKIIDENPMISCHQISRDTEIPYSTVHYTLVHHLKYKCRRLHWIPHSLSEQNKLQRVECCNQILKILQHQKMINWRYIITGDESWFFYHTPNGFQWIPEDEEVQEDIKNSSYSTKIMVTIFWNPNGIAILNALPIGHTMNGDTFLSTILQPLREYKYYNEAKQSRKKFYIHFDNCPSHKKANVIQFLNDKKFTNVPQPPYSPDLAPSDYYLFSKLKDKLKGRTFKTAEEIQEAIRDEFLKIPKDELISVFDGWIARCEECLKRNGAYVE